MDQHNTVVLIEKPQMNHSTSDIKVKLTSLSISNDDVKANKFSESDKNNGKIDENGESKILCDNEWTNFVAYLNNQVANFTPAKGVWRACP